MHYKKWQRDKGSRTRYPGRTKGGWVISEHPYDHLREPEESQTEGSQNNRAAGRGSTGNFLDFATDILPLDFCTAGQDLVTCQ